MTRPILLVLLTALAVVSSFPASAQVATGNKDDIVVTGRRDKEIERFVRSLAAAKDDRQLARWNSRICVKIYGLWPEIDKTILDHFAAVAKRVGVEFRAWPKCSVNTVIVFTDEADKFTAAAIDKMPDLVTNTDLFGLPGRKRIALYLTPRPVRWLPINETTMSDGTPTNQTIPGAGGMAPSSPIPPSRITMRTRENTLGALIVVDESKVGGIKWSQLADYLAMVSFAQPAIDADFADADSIMSIFAARDAAKPGPIGLTTQDNAFLTALYRSDANLSASQQRGEVSGALKRPRKDR